MDNVTLVVTHTVSDLPGWKKRLEDKMGSWPGAGIRLLGVFQSLASDGQVTLIAEVTHLEAAIGFNSNSALKEMMKDVAVASTEVKILKSL